MVVIFIQFQAFQEVPIPELLNGKIMQFFKMRLLLRLSKRDGELNINEQIAAILADPVKHPVFTSNADDAIFKYTGIYPYYNPYFNTRQLEWRDGTYVTNSLSIK
jgi:hypothetical protein